jgi:hypothetical protein
VESIWNDFDAAATFCECGSKFNAVCVCVYSEPDAQRCRIVRADSESDQIVTCSEYPEAEFSFDALVSVSSTFDVSFGQLSPMQLVTGIWFEDGWVDSSVHASTLALEFSGGTYQNVRALIVVARSVRRESQCL